MEGLGIATLKPLTTHLRLTYGTINALFLQKNGRKVHFFLEKLAYIKNLQYLCTVKVKNIV